MRAHWIVTGAVLAVLMGGGCRSGDAGTAGAGVPSSGSRRDPSALWHIVDTCVNRAASAACTCGPFLLSCCGDTRTPKANVVWRLTDQFVAIRDLTACGCPPDFVAGLALPRARVSGIEDPARPEGIWPFAWDTASARIADPLEIGLAINPVETRSQNQMHVHLLRLKPGARDVIDALAHAAPPDGPIVAELPDLTAGLATAVARVGAERIGRHGILVLGAGAGGYRAVITDRTSPQVYTRNGCR